MRIKTAVAIGTIGMATAMTAGADVLLTGGKSGAYYNDIGPRVHEVLQKALFRYPLEEGKGSAGNFMAIVDNPMVVGLGQADVYAMMNGENPGKVIAIPTGVRECLFAVTANEGIAGANEGDGWGNMMSLARRMRVALPSEQSGSAKTFHFIQSINDKLAAADNIVYQQSTDDAVKAVKQGDADVAFFVQMPDTSNPLFKLIKENELGWIGVGDRTMLRQEFGGDKVYAVESVPVEQTWGGFGTPKSIITTCTQVVVMTGDPSREDAGDADSLKEQVELLTANAGQFEPQAGWYTSMVAKVQTVSGPAVDKMVETADKAAGMVNNALQ
jgi:hypothetical protein